jgi:hypothetical protein
VGTNTGRTDIEFVYLPEAISAMGRAARLTADSVADGKFELYDLGGGIKVASPAFDALLAADPEEAAEIMRKLQEIRREQSM